MKSTVAQTRILFTNGQTLEVNQTVKEITTEMKSRDGYATVTFKCDSTPTGFAEFTFNDDQVTEYDGLCNIEE